LYSDEERNSCPQSLQMETITSGDLIMMISEMSLKRLHDIRKIYSFFIMRYKQGYYD